MPRRIRQSLLLSCCLHGALMSVLLTSWKRAPRMEPMRLPGTQHGARLLTYYSPGGKPARAASAPRAKSHENRTTPPPPLPVVAGQIAPVAAKASDPGLGDAGLSSLGQGNINIALQKFFPAPRPDLSALAPGQKGDVVVDAVIDADGSIKELTLLRSLNPAIDWTVLATVRRWTYTPATKDGQPVPSEQELHFHFERG